MVLIFRKIVFTRYLQLLKTRCMKLIFARKLIKSLLMKVNKAELYETLKQWIGIEVTDETIFFEESGVTGLDAEQMMIQLQEKYGLNLDDYDPCHYHLDEIEIANFLLHIWRAIRGTSPKHIQLLHFICKMQ